MRTGGRTPTRNDHEPRAEAPSNHLTIVEEGQSVFIATDTAYACPAEERKRDEAFSLSK